MAKLTTAHRNKLPASSFAGPGRSFPLTDKSHDRAAISGATRSERAGNISASTEARIKSEARAKLGMSSHAKAVKKATGYK
ncbi:MAG TPA: hypothetical protein VF456_20290 [Vicinamibacterales bacterium]